jgi:bifunctional non-homologous end joining protein LigD
VDPLRDYRSKRRPGRTPEPIPADPPVASPEPVFVVQEHHARRLHWDFRLERDGVLVSWALPRGVPDDPAQNHLAVHTEDHPLEYATFAGEIPRGEYGGGQVTIWDHGSYDTVKWTADEVKVVLYGQRLTGGYTLFRTGDNWMIHRERRQLPGRIEPMLARIGELPPDDGNWAYEMKWDGLRALAYVSDGRARLLSRTGQDITRDYPELAGLGAALGSRQAVLDGEIVALGGDGWPDFELLQQRMNARPGPAYQRLLSEVPVTYLAFDLLHLDGRSLLDEPYQQRRAQLSALGLTGARWQTPPSFTSEAGPDVQAVSVQHGLEGIVAKRLASRYEPGKRTGSWRKIKNVRQQEVVVGGWKPGEGNRAGQIGSLLIGVQDEAGLQYAGHVGTGFSQQTLHMLGELLAPLRRATSPFASPVPPEHARPAEWVEPSVVIEVGFAGWTRAGRMRAPTYRGLRPDKDPAEAVREP